jgi:hypothetical protein
MWVVEEGLNVGEVVVAEGTQKVRPGMIVEPKPFAGTAAENTGSTAERN